MQGPARGIRFVHTAINREAAELERLAQAGERAMVEARLGFFERLLDLHNRGEELGLFPEIAAREPDVVDPYLLDHHVDHELWAAVKRAIPDTGLALIRALGALRDHLRLHIRKEEELIVPLVERLFTPAEQGAQVGKMMSVFSPEDLAQVLPWLVSWLDVDDRRAYLAILEAAAPPERFAAALATIRAGVAPEVWDSLGR